MFILLCAICFHGHWYKFYLTFIYTVAAVINLPVLYHNAILCLVFLVSFSPFWYLRNASAAKANAKRRMWPCKLQSYHIKGLNETKTTGSVLLCAFVSKGKFYATLFDQNSSLFFFFLQPYCSGLIVNARPSIIHPYNFVAIEGLWNKLI